MKKKKSKLEVSAQEAIDVCHTFPEEQGGAEREVVGIITDQDEALTFLKWLMSDDAKRLSEKIRAQKEGRQS